jgi:general secretion pathway protein D
MPQGGMQQVASTAPSGGGMIQADTSSNTLIVTASEPVYNNIRSVIERLDVRRPQIFVEALIVEVTADKAAEFGVQWQNLTGINRSGRNIIGGTNFGAATSGSNIITASGNITSVGQGLNIGIVNGTTTIPGVGTVLNLGMLARALETDTNANILSAPNLMTLDNEEAKIVVGQNVPFITGSYQPPTSSNPSNQSPFQTIERKDVGLTLKIKPQIMQGGTVKLQVYQEVSSVVASATTSAGFITNKRSIESNILVDENQIVVLGGLIQDSVNNVQSKTPLLGDIPFLGNLFRYETRQRTKTNLMVFIRPYIMYQENGYQKLTTDRYEQMDKKREDGRLSNHWFLPDDTEKLPELKAEDKAPAASAPAAPAPGTDAAAPAATPAVDAASAPAAASPADPSMQP